MIFSINCVNIILMRYLCALLLCLPAFTLADPSELDLEANKIKPLITAKMPEHSKLESIAKNPYAIVSKYCVIAAATLYCLYLIPQVRPFLQQSGAIIAITGSYGPGLIFMLSCVLLPGLVAALIEIIRPIMRLWYNAQNKAYSKFGDLKKLTHVTEELLEYSEKDINELFNEFAEKAKTKNSDCIFTMLYGEPGTGKTALPKHLAEKIQAYYGLQEAGSDSFLMQGVTSSIYETIMAKIIDAAKKDNVVFTMDDVFCGQRSTGTTGIIGKEDKGANTLTALAFYNTLCAELKQRKENGEKLHNVFLFITSNAIYDEPGHERFMEIDSALKRRLDYAKRVNPLNSEQITNAVLMNLEKIHTNYPKGELRKFVTDLLAGTSLDISSIVRILKRVYESEKDYDAFKTKATKEIESKINMLPNAA